MKIKELNQIHSYNYLGINELGRVQHRHIKEKKGWWNFIDELDLFLKQELNVKK